MLTVAQTWRVRTTSGAQRPLLKASANRRARTQVSHFIANTHSPC